MTASAEDVVTGGTAGQGEVEASGACACRPGHPEEGLAQVDPGAAMCEGCVRGGAACATGLGDLPPLTVAIQAGGESKRMGRSKATVPFLGRPLIERIVGRVAPIATEILITTNEPENLGFLEQVPAAPKIRLVRDLKDYRGSLTGLYTALSLASCDYLAVCACDMIFVCPELICAEFALLAADPTLDAVVPRTDFGFEPFHGVYRRRSCLARLEVALAGGAKSMRAFLESVERRDFTIAEVSRVVPQGRCFINANTPAELAKAESIAREVEYGEPR